jgi:hypothetical protein
VKSRDRIVIAGLLVGLEPHLEEQTFAYTSEMTKRILI